MRSIYLIFLTAIIITLITFLKNSYSNVPRSSFMETIMWNEKKQDKSTPEIEKYKFLEEDEENLVSDPLYHFNKTIFILNDKIYLYLLNPILKHYNSIIPISVRISIRNFFNNITMPARFINCLLQFKWDAAQGEMARFIINSTFGIGGLLNPASKYEELNPPVEDLGQTLGSYKIGNGFYIVWPILGPSTLRDSAGMIGDWFLNPIHQIVEETSIKLSLSSLKSINNSSLKIDQYLMIKEASFDPYESFRNAYIQNRKAKVSQ